MSKGICFIEPLFNKVVAGEKTQTRRIIKPQPNDSGLWNDDLYPRALDSTLTGFNGTIDETGESKEFKPKYKLGEVVYLKEPYVICFNINGKYITYKFVSAIGQECDKAGVKWQNKLFMPESAARYFIKITGVRAERLQDISEKDCIKEGVELYNNYDGTYGGNGAPMTYKESYAVLIDKINGKGVFQSNPFVWVYDFKLTDK